MPVFVKSVGFQATSKTAKQVMLSQKGMEHVRQGDLPHRSKLADQRHHWDLSLAVQPANNDREFKMMYQDS